MASLQDQLLKAGIVDKKKVNKVKKEQQKKKKQQQQPKGQKTVSETRLMAEKTLADKAARDRAINIERRDQAEKKAIKAQIVQLVANHQIKRDGDQTYQFVDQNKVKKIYVSALQHRQIERGVLSVVRDLHINSPIPATGGQEPRYQLVPAQVAEKIQQRDTHYIVVFNTNLAPEESLAEDDPYADYQIPDDLMW